MATKNPQIVGELVDELLVQDERDGLVHVVPLVGRIHDASCECWCVPGRDASDRRLIVHRAMN